MKLKRLLFLTLFIGSIFTVFSQETEKQVSYSSPSEYKIGGINVTGTKYLDPDILTTLSGLSVGDDISIPGDEISNALKSLWQQGLFTDVKIYVSKIIGSTVFLEINLQERPRLSRFSLNGIKKGETEDLREKIQLIKGRVVTENTKMNTANIIKNFYKEKGFLNAKVIIREVPDTLLSNSVLLEIDIRKGKKVKIDRVLIYGNNNVPSKKLKKLMKETKEKPRFDLKGMLNRDNIVAALKKNGTVGNFLNNFSGSRIYNYTSEFTQMNIFSGSKFLKNEYKSDRLKIIEYYNSKGYRDATLIRDSIYSYGKNLRIEIHLKEGNVYYFRNIVWVGNTKYTDQELFNVLDIKKGDIYDQSRLDERLFMSQNGNDVSSLYMDDGYLFFQVTPVEVAVENDSIDLQIRIYEGPQATINEVRIYGNTKTKEHIVRRELRTLPGNKFSRSDLIRSQREIANLGYFDPEQMQVIPIPNPEKGTVDIEYHVVEKPSDQLELSAGWGGSGQGVVGTLGVSFTNFSLQNMFKKGFWTPLPSGDGQKLSLRAQTNGKIYQSYNISFTEPWLGGKKPNSFTVSYYHSRYADLDINNKVDGRLITNGGTLGIGTRLKWPDDFFTFYSAFNVQSFKLQNWNSSSFSFSNGVSNNLNLQFVLSRNSIDKPIFPTRGSNISLTLQLTAPYSSFREDEFWKLSDDELTAINEDGSLSETGKALKIIETENARKFKWVEYHKWRFNAEWFTPLTKGKNPLVLRVSAKFGFLGQYNKAIGYSPFERFEIGGDGISNITFYGRDIISLRGYDVLSPSSGAPFFDKFTAELRYPFSQNPSSTIYALAFMEAGNYWNDIKSYNPFDVKRAAGIGVRIFLPMFGMLGFDYGIGFDKDLGDATSFGNYLSKYGKFSIVLGFEPE